MNIVMYCVFLNKQLLSFQNCFGMLSWLRCQEGIRRPLLITAVPASNINTASRSLSASYRLNGLNVGCETLEAFDPAPKLFFVNVTFISELLKWLIRKEKKAFSRVTPPPQKTTHTNVYTSDFALRIIKIQNIMCSKCFFKLNFVMNAVKMSVEICAGTITHLTHLFQSCCLFLGARLRVYEVSQHVL
jgi:hypothetical protein